VDFASLDNQAVDVFLDSFSSSDKASVTKHMTKQLKALRSLLAISGQMTTGLMSEATIHTIIEETANIINAEKIFVLDIDHQQGNLVVTHSPDNTCNGIRTSSDTGIEASVLSQRKGLVINDLSSSTLMNMEFYQQLQVCAKNVISAPILVGDTVIGILIGFNKQADDFNFTNFDLSCLETIAANLAVVYQCSIQSKMRPSINQFVDSPKSVVTYQSQTTAEFEHILKDIVKDTYRLLGADRISVFVDHGNQELLCVSSQDIKGSIVPASSGLLGECFRNRIAFNVPNVKADKRHFKAMDEWVKYETVSLICVPLIGLNDEVLGVMEGVNKVHGNAFTTEHELMLQQLGHRVAIMLSQLKAKTLQMSNPNVTIVRNLGDFSTEVCVSTPKCPSQLIDIIQKYGRNIAGCDHIYHYSSAPDSSESNLILERNKSPDPSTSRCQGSQIHPKVREALTSKLPTEFYMSETDVEEVIMPGITAKTALIIPLISFPSPKATIDVLIITRKQRSPPSVTFANSETAAINLETVFLSAVHSYSQASFNALETQGLISLASVFNNALHFYAHAKAEDRDRSGHSEGTVGSTPTPPVVLSKFDCPTVLSTLCVEDQTELSHLFEWHFNVLNIKDKAALHYAVMSLLDKECNFLELNIDREKVFAYILEVDNSYLQNPFHNFYHAVCVTHFDYMLLNVSDAKTHLSPFMIFASLLSALVHDVAHPGNTNMFEINMRSNLAILYNDTSVLENHHCSTAFKLMNKSGLGIFDGMEFGERAEIRKMMIACIIATDMHYHVSLIELISNRASQEEWHIDSFTERMNYGKILLHAADLSNPTRPFVTSRAWAERVSEEFNAQGKNEKANGIPVSTFLLSHDLKSFVKNELFFSGHIVFPMWKELVRLYPSMSHITDQIANNLDSWKGLLK
jgi:transcriptional regulator with GAF, ATPase, and Fis domain